MHRATSIGPSGATLGGARGEGAAFCRTYTAECRKGMQLLHRSRQRSGPARVPGGHFTLAYQHAASLTGAACVPGGSPRGSQGNRFFVTARNGNWFSLFPPLHPIPPYIPRGDVIDITKCVHFTHTPLYVAGNGNRLLARFCWGKWLGRSSTSPRGPRGDSGAPDKRVFMWQNATLSLPPGA